MKKYLPILFIILLVSIFFKDFLIKGLIPIPADTIVGLYHPWRDEKWGDFSNGVPYKNFLITDPVRQQYPWKMLSINYLKNGQIPKWNPYTFSGSPLLANFQSGVFYPFNLIFFILPFNIAWGMFIILQFLLGGIFMYLYLKHIKLITEAALIGSIAFIFSGFFIAWSEWGNIVHTIIWVPLILLAKDKIIENGSVKWISILIFSEISMFFAGHIQIAFYCFLFTTIYLIIKIWQKYLKQIIINGNTNKLKHLIKILFPFIMIGSIVALITSIQWLSTLHYILLSARSVDQINWQQQGWFLPWQNLIQFIAPDFFGNPSTLNYWGVWNYGEFIGYIGIMPLIFAVYALFNRKDKKTLFFGTTFFLSLLFTLPTFIAKIPFLLNLPFISTSQPTRLMSLIVLSLCILSALGIDLLLRKKDYRNLSKIIGTFFILYLCLWAFVLFGQKIMIGNEWANNLLIAKRNLIFPTIVFLGSATLYLGCVKIKSKNISNIFKGLLILLFCVDLFRFGWKFLPFTKEDWIFPNTKTIEFLQEKQKEGLFRIMSTDSRIFPPNFSIPYKIETVDGYDPLFLKTYAELIIASERGKPDISPPFGFNRIITPHNFNSPVIDILNVKYVLSLNEINSHKLTKVFQEGETRVYENRKVLPRAFIITKNIPRDSVNDTFEIKASDINKIGTAMITEYSSKNLIINVNSTVSAMLIISQNYTPDWKVSINGNRVEYLKVFQSLLGIPVPKGMSEVKVNI